MKWHTPSILVLVAACVAACQRPRVSTEADVAAIRAVNQEAAAAHVAGDAARWANLLTADGVLMPEGAPAVTGRDSLAAWARAFYNANRVSTLTIEPVEIEVAGDWGFSRDRVSGTLTPTAGGPSFPMVLKQIVIWRRQPDGSWKAARVIANSDPPPDPRP